MTTRSQAPRESAAAVAAPFADGEAILHGMQAIVGRKWQPVIVFRLLVDGPTGFSGLKRSVDGISSKMLSESLSGLEEAGLVEREQVCDEPVRVEYSLTERGRALEPVIVELIDWGSEYDVASSHSPTARRRLERAPPRH